MIFQGCPIKGKLTIVYHHGWSNLLHLSDPDFFPFIATHWILKHFIIGKGWPSQDLFCVNMPNILRARGH